MAYEDEKGKWVFIPYKKDDFSLVGIIVGIIIVVGIIYAAITILAHTLIYFWEIVLLYVTYPFSWALFGFDTVIEHSNFEIRRLDNAYYELLGLYVYSIVVITVYYFIYKGLASFDRNKKIMILAAIYFVGSFISLYVNFVKGYESYSGYLANSILG